MFPIHTFFGFAIIYILLDVFVFFLLKLTIIMDVLFCFFLWTSFKSDSELKILSKECSAVSEPHPAFAYEIYATSILADDEPRLLLWCFSLIDN